MVTKYHFFRKILGTQDATEDVRSSLSDFGCLTLSDPKSRGCLELAKLELTSNFISVFSFEVDGNCNNLENLNK